MSPGGAPDRSFTEIGSRTVYDGRILRLEIGTFRYAGGTEEEREIVRSRGAVAVVAIDADHVWLVRQPREVIADPDSLEIPAGRLDKDGEQPLAAAKRELAEEIGARSDRWTNLTSYHSSVGMTDELVHIFVAEDITQLNERADSGEDERIELVRHPLAELAALIDSVTDSKTLIGLLLLERRLRAC